MVEELWDEYYKGLNDSKKRLIEHYLPLVKVIAKTTYARIPNSSVQLDELISAGVLGLVRAIENYNPRLRLKFTTYAIPRIKGSILDELRNIDFLPRSARDKVKLYKKKSAELMTKLGRVPFNVEIAEEMNLPITVLYYYESSNHPISLYNEINKEDEQGVRLIELIPKLMDNPIKDIEKKERRELLLKSINTLSAKEKVIVGLHYLEGVPFKDISHLFSSTESRISQIHTGALKKIKTKLMATIG